MYGLLAETIEWPEDRSWIIFHLNPKARWHDGEPVTADDVIFSFRTLVEKGHPQYRFYYQSVTDVEKLDERSVKFTYEAGENRELPLIMGRSEEHTSELQSLMRLSYAVFCLQKTTNDALIVVAR